MLPNSVQPVDYLILDLHCQLRSMCIQKSCGKLRELNIVGFVDELGSELLLPRDGCAHRDDQVRYWKDPIKLGKYINWKMQFTCNEYSTAE